MFAYHTYYLAFISALNIWIITLIKQERQLQRDHYLSWSSLTSPFFVLRQKTRSFAFFHCFLWCRMYGKSKVKPVKGKIYSLDLNKNILIMPTPYCSLRKSIIKHLLWNWRNCWKCTITFSSKTYAFILNTKMC